MSVILFRLQRVFVRIDEYQAYQPMYLYDTFIRHISPQGLILLMWIN